MKAIIEFSHEEIVKMVLDKCWYVMKDSKEFNNKVRFDYDALSGSLTAIVEGEKND